MTLLLWLMACAPLSPSEVPVKSTAVRTPLPGPQRLRRLSLDLRGVLPSSAELDSIAEQPDRWIDLRESYLADPRFEDRMVSLFAERWRTRVDVFDVVYQDFAMDPTEEFHFEQSVGEEPLRLMATASWGLYIRLPSVCMSSHTLSSSFAYPSSTCSSVRQMPV